MLLDPPKNVAFPEKLAPGAKLLALVLIYGTKNAGRGLWKKLWKILHELGLVENFVYKALYNFHDGERCVMIRALTLTTSSGQIFQKLSGWCKKSGDC